MKFIAEKVSHNPVIMAYHAEGEGWELWATSAGRTKFWGKGSIDIFFWSEIHRPFLVLGKSLEIIPLGTIHVKIGSDHYQWWVFMRPYGIRVIKINLTGYQGRNLRRSCGTS